MPDFLLKIVLIILIFAFSAALWLSIIHSFRIGRIYTREYVRRSTDPLAFWLSQILTAIAALALFSGGVIFILRF